MNQEILTLADLEVRKQNCRNQDGLDKAVEDHYFNCDSVYFYKELKYTGYAILADHKIVFIDSGKPEFCKSVENDQVLNYFQVNNRLEKEGRYLELFPDGTIKMRGRYNADRKNGLWTEYYPSGNIKSEKRFNFDTPKEWWFYYSEEGKQTTIEIYNEGKMETLGKPVYKSENGVGYSKYYDVSTTFYDAVSGKALYQKKERHFTERDYVFPIEYTEL